MTEKTDHNSSHRFFSAAQLSGAEMYGMLSTAVAPRPIAFASTISAGGTVNLSPYSFFNVVGFNPPMLVFCPLRRGRDGTLKDTVNNLREVPEVIVNVVEHAIVEQASLASTNYPPEVDEFTKAGLTPVPVAGFRPPRVAESAVSFACRVHDIIETGTEGGGGSLVIARVEGVFVRPELLDADGKLDPDALDLVGRMGGNYYVRASGAAFFEIPKPLRHLGIGIDALPQGVRESDQLTGNQLARLGNQEKLPTAEETQAIVASLGIRSTAEQINKIAELLEAGRDREALALAFHQARKKA
ncbi:flavin reductase family protein [Lewinella sp. W8]|uniref:flavin reductase family protein n=1 Tax=Lewinella sp. W8 TaxID=2528208 RepID=UPI001067EB3B|nr:flavin reductase family protein [Lewinella sp. W8]MTB53148.1 flavin reductase family protein [Lewinella sp. W8]